MNWSMLAISAGILLMWSIATASIGRRLQNRFKPSAADLPRIYRGTKKMKKAILAAALMLAANAYAAQTNNGCQGNCPTSGGGGNATATGGNANSSSVGIGIGVGGQGGAGGAGGQGGSGGSASAIGQGGAGGVGIGGMGGNVTGSGNSANSNLNTQGQHQGQGQSQAANSNQSQSSKNDSNATNSTKVDGNNAAQTTRVEGDTYVSVYRAAANTAYAPPIAPTALCMGSSSAGGTGMTFGFSIGTSWTDSNCMLLEQVRTVAVVLADKETAAEMMCTVEAYRAAREKSGKPC